MFGTCWEKLRVLIFSSRIIRHAHFVDPLQEHSNRAVGQFSRSSKMRSARAVVVWNGAIILQPRRGKRNVKKFVRQCKGGLSGKCCLVFTTTLLLLIDRTTTASGVSDWQPLVHRILQVREAACCDQKNSKIHGPKSRCRAEAHQLHLFMCNFRLFVINSGRNRW